MIIFPAMDLWGDKVVKLDARYHATLEKTYGTAPEVLGRIRAAGASWIHVIDVGSAVEGGTPGRMAAQALTKAAAPIQVQFGGGLRDDSAIHDAAQLFPRVILGTKAIRNPNEFEVLARRHPAKFVVALDATGVDVVIEGWQKKSGNKVDELARVFDGMPIAGYLYTNVSVEGKSRGVDWGPVEAVMRATKHPVVFAGGVSSMDDVRRFRDHGAYGLVLGSAMYSGKVDLAEAIAEAK